MQCRGADLTWIVITNEDVVRSSRDWLICFLALDVRA